MTPAETAALHKAARRKERRESTRFVNLMRCWIGGDQNDYLPPDEDVPDTTPTTAEYNELAAALTDYTAAHNRQPHG